MRTDDNDGPRPTKRLGIVLLGLAAFVALVLICVVALIPESEGGFEARFLVLPFLAVGALVAAVLLLGGGALSLYPSAPPGPRATTPSPPLSVLTIDREE